MSNNRTRLRELGYSADADGNLVCHREAAASFNRYLHERCGIIRIDLERDTKPSRELVERLIAAADEPRALIGRSRNGSAVLLFRVDKHSDIPQTADDGASNLITRDGVRFAIAYGSVDRTLDVSAYSWPKGRSPLDVSRDALAVLFCDIGQAVVDEAYKSAAGALTEAELEREREREERIARLNAEVAAGMHTDEARQAAEDERLVAAHPDAVATDGLWVQEVFHARARVRARREAAARETA
jgi:hypothetical protein